MPPRQAGRLPHKGDREAATLAAPWPFPDALPVR